MKSINSFSLSGRLTSDAHFFDAKTGKVARFSIAHNFGKGIPALFIDAVMFSKNGKKEIAIPEDLLKKGTPVAISGYFRPNVQTKVGGTVTTTDFVVTSCEALAEEGAEA